jgi:hypothetical protein
MEETSLKEKLKQIENELNYLCNAYHLKLNISEYEQCNTRDGKVYTYKINALKMI